MIEHGPVGDGSAPIRVSSTVEHSTRAQIRARPTDERRARTGDSGGCSRLATRSCSSLWTSTETKRLRKRGPSRRWRRLYHRAYSQPNRCMAADNSPSGDRARKWKVVVHECVGMDLEESATNELPGVVFQHVPVFVVADDVLAVGAAIHQVLPCTSRVMSWWSSHGDTMTMGCRSRTVTFDPARCDSWGGGRGFGVPIALVHGIRSRHGAQGVPDPRPSDRRQAAGVPRLREHLAEASPGDPRDVGVPRTVIRADQPQLLPTRRRSDRGVRGRPSRHRTADQCPVGRRGRVHQERDRVDEPHCIGMGQGQPPRR
jgi:hypothetical protein